MPSAEKISDILSKIYYDTENPSGYASQAKLLHAANLIDPTITLKNVRDWLSGQLTYTLHKSVRRNFLRNKIIVSDIDEGWQADLVDLQEFKSKNKGNGYILTIIDVFSKFAWGIPIKNKGSRAVASAFKELFEKEKRVPTKLQTDKGTEFLNREVQSIFKEYGVHHFTAINPKTKCSVVERFNRTLKSKMFKYFTARGTRKYIDVLPALVSSYNNSIHRGTGKRPAWVKDSHRKEIMLKLYGVLSRRELLKKHYQMSKAGNARISVGNTVRRTYELKPGFDKSYYPNWTDETFKVEKIINKMPRKVYKVADENENPLQRLFYQDELQKVDPNGFYRVEKVIRRRKKSNGDTEYLVKYLGFPASYNQWIPAANLQHLRSH
ncbi:uncharacterized protein LOC141851662 [Brevipalpus obovatus]|uniref:uncharacterized protein LOC141851662 n=1 Tax=Brevipalpus obovatus TaxID=246614 RepID=UPI003D9EE23C